MKNRIRISDLILPACILIGGIMVCVKEDTTIKFTQIDWQIELPGDLDQNVQEVTDSLLEKHGKPEKIVVTHGRSTDSVSHIEVATLYGNYILSANEDTLFIQPEIALTLPVKQISSDLNKSLTQILISSLKL